YITNVPTLTVGPLDTSSFGINPEGFLLVQYRSRFTRLEIPIFGVSGIVSPGSVLGLMPVERLWLNGNMKNRKSEM
ncbi:hypothetical protein K7432_010239, partial [Basidiobolus ranarum]